MGNKIKIKIPDKESFFIDKVLDKVKERKSVTEKSNKKGKKKNESGN